MDKGKILIVEDDEFLREIYKETVADLGNVVETAIDGEQALQKIPQGQYDLILLDIILPKVNGLDVIKKLKEQNTFPQKSKVIFLTNLDKDEEIKQALQLGDGYLIKSQLTPGDLSKEVNLFFAKRAS